ncbi:MAG: hypothetical protein M3Z64_12270 [Verrucomicrobiota bacterium]|nr:hypothetical protein [Verrucomicrobiota bacterium]
MKVKTVRFAQIVERCGAPEVYTLWQKPAADRHFQTLLKNERLMTVRPRTSGADFGEVGFVKNKTATYLAFPKPLKRFRDKCIVGIKWDLVKS